jgi:diguanylate cyclase
LLEALTNWLFEAACRQARRWQDQGLERLHLALPLLSRRQLTWSGQLGAQLRGAGVAPDRLEIELCEELLLAAIGGGTLWALKDLGVRLALDGYRRGPTSLRGLQLGVLDTLKLARELHQDVPGDAQRGALVGAIVVLARALGLRVVAEGVDRQEQLGYLRRCGCDAVQGFMSCPPLPAEACTSWLRQASGRRDGGRGPVPGRPYPALPAPVRERRAASPAGLSGGRRELARAAGEPG